MYNFLKDTRKDFFGKKESFFTPTYYTVVVVYHDGYSKEYQAITKPWQYIRKVKLNPKVKTAYIK